MERLTRVFAHALLWTAALLGTPLAQAQSFFAVQDEGSLSAQVYSEQTARFTVHGHAGRLNFNVVANQGGALAHGASPHWFVTLVAPPGERLKPGFYADVGCPTATFGRAAGLQVTDDNPRCSGDDTIWGWFTIRQISYDDAGAIASLEATFSQRVGSPTAPARTGRLRYKASHLSLKLSSAKNSPWGLLQQEHHGDSSLFALSGDATGFAYEASVIKDLWSVFVAPPEGRALAVGRYSTRAEAGGPHLAMSVVRGLEEPMYCPDSEGMLEITDLDFDPSGNIAAMRAKFHFRCTPGGAVLKGDIRFHR